MSPQKLARSMMRAGADAGEAAANSAVTIAARLPILAGHMLSPTAAGLAEWNRAYAEKAAAAWEGMFAASAAWQRMMLRAAFSPPTAFGLAKDLVGVGQKAGHAARKRVRANAKRLSRRRRSG